MHELKEPRGLELTFQLFNSPLLITSFWTLVFTSVKWGCMVLSSLRDGTYMYQNHGEEGAFRNHIDLQV